MVLSARYRASPTYGKAPSWNSLIGFPVDALQRRFGAIHQGDDNVPVARRVGTFYENKITVTDVVVDHRLPANL